MEQGARAAGVESFRELPAAGASRSKIERVVPSNALPRLGIDSPDTTEGRVEDPKKYSKEEGDEVELKVAEVLRRTSRIMSRALLPVSTGSKRTVRTQMLSLRIRRRLRKMSQAT